MTSVSDATDRGVLSESSVCAAIDTAIGPNAMQHSPHTHNSGGVPIPALIQIIAAYAAPFVTTKTIYRFGEENFAPGFAVDDNTGTGPTTTGSGTGWSVMGRWKRIFVRVSSHGGGA